MTGANPPLDGSGLEHDVKWCLSFRNGGVGTFLRLFYQLLQEMRNRMSQQQQPAAGTPAATPVPADVAMGFVQAAFVDPSDPTKLYVSQ